MKKKAILALTLAGLVVLQMPMVALADTSKHQHNGVDVTSEQGNQDVTGIGKTAVDVSGSTVNCSVGNVVAKSASAIDRDSHNAIFAEKGATVTAYSAKNDSYNNPTIVAMGSGTTVTIKTQDGAAGDVTNSGEESAISATTNATVTAGSATNNGEEATVEAYHAATVTVNEAVTNNGNGNAIHAVNGATVTAGDAVGGLNGVFAENGAKVVVESVTAMKGSDGDCAGISAQNAGSIIVVNGDVNSSSNGAFAADGGTAIVLGTITGGSWYGAGTDGNGEILAYEIKGGDTGLILGPEDNIFYIIKGIDGEKISADSGITVKDYTSVMNDGNTYKYNTANKDTVITVSVASGYELKAGTLTVTKEADGTYSITVPEGGGVTLEAVMAAVQQAQAAEAEEKKATVTGSEGSAVNGGQWNVGPGGYWTYRNNGIFKDTWGYITLANGKTGWFWFDKNGVMATGWKQINGKWYYFNEVNDGTQGMMLTNTTTPDGNKVGADGVWIQ